MARKGKIEQRLERLSDKANEVLENKMCGFEWEKPCIRKCIYYNTCTRNPYRYDQRKE